MWSGQYEYLERAAARLKIVVPVTLVIIFLLLYLNFRSITETMIVMLSLPFALVGGLWLMWWLDFYLSVAVAVGFIALAGVAAETGVVMLMYLNQALAEKRTKCEVAGRALLTRGDLYDANAGRSRARTAKDDDGGRYHGGTVADHVEHRHRLRDHAAHRSADDRRYDFFNAADPDRDPGDLRTGHGFRTAERTE
jgi:copper/silver efflux system protein